jgi:arylsulfatase A-like enzyme
VRYPKEIKAGTKSKNWFKTSILRPTFLDYAGVEIPEDMQGESFRIW